MSYANKYTVPDVTDTERTLQTNGTPVVKCAILIVGNVVPPSVVGCSVIVPAGDVPDAGNTPQFPPKEPDWPAVNANVVVVL